MGILDTSPTDTVDTDTQMHYNNKVSNQAICKTSFSHDVL